MCGRVSRHWGTGIHNAGGVPVVGARREKVSWGHGHGAGVCAHKVHFGLVAVVALSVGLSSGEF